MVRSSQNLAEPVVSSLEILNKTGLNQNCHKAGTLRAKSHFTFYTYFSMIEVMIHLHICQANSRIQYMPQSPITERKKGLKRDLQVHVAC